MRDQHDAAAIVLHLAMREKGFVCVSTSDASTTETKDLGVIPPGWSSSSDGYCFQYRHNDLPGKTVLMKALRMEQYLLVHAVGADGKIRSVDIDTQQYVNKDAPLDDYERLFKDLPGLIGAFDRSVRSQVAPPPKAEARDEAPAAGAVPRHPAVPPPAFDPLRDDRYRPQPVPPVYDPDLDPLGPGLPPLGPGGPRPMPGNLIGPGHLGGRGRGIPRFDPFGPAPGIGGEPDFDEALPPGPLGPRPPLGRGRGGGSGSGGFPFGGPGRGFPFGGGGGFFGGYII